MDQMASPCSADVLGIWFPDATASTAKKQKSIAARVNWLQKKSTLASDALNQTPKGLALPLLLPSLI